MNMTTLKFYSPTAEKITINCPRLVTDNVSGTIILYLKDFTAEAHKEVTDILFNNEVTFVSYFNKDNSDLYTIEINLQDVFGLQIIEK